MTRHCFKCGWEYPLSGQPGRSETCPRCGSDLKVCLNCVHYDPHAAYQCREKRAEPVQEKHLANFCEYFEFAKREFRPNTEEFKREQAAREQLRKLLGD
jgi:ribosome-binding protein aMBF1 (putative translation factor)